MKYHQKQVKLFVITINNSKLRITYMNLENLNSPRYNKLRLKKTDLS